ncbi:MAG: PD40 domain-containing protein [Calditrichae bacterium]|nr:PD40 domain-containing protein [Calditrichia bacterium]
MIFFLFSCEDNTIKPEDEGTIEGIVLDQVSSNAISGAIITTSPATNAIVTDNEGKFILPDIPVNTYSISATKLNYKKNSVSVEVRNDRTAQATILLTPEETILPEIPSGPFPANNSTDQPINILLTWKAQSLISSDSVYYDVYLFRPNAAPEIIASNQTDTSLYLEDLSYNTIYNWKVDAKDNAGNKAASDIWTFKTKVFPEYSVIYAKITDQNYNIFATDAEEGIVTLQLTNSLYRNWWPRFSPDKSKIAFSSNEEVDNHIYIINTEGKEKERLTDVPVSANYNNGIGFAWSANGDYLIYCSYDKLMRIKSDGSELRQIAQAPSGMQFRECDWAPTDDKIVTLAVGNSFYSSQIYLMDTDGSDQQLLLDDLPGAVENPAFAPSGNKILFTHDVSGYEVTSGRQLDSHIIILSTDSSDTTDVSQNKPDGSNDSFPRWSPDGAKIIFCSAPNYDDSKRSIWVMNSDGSDRKKLIESGLMPDWR